MKSNNTSKEIVMLPLSEILSIKWTDERRQRLREIRGEMTLVELSKRLESHGIKVSRQYLHRMESDSDVRGATPELVQGICAVFNVTEADLLCLNSHKIVQLGVDK
jgi:DNA polymerase I-like protein with 3'-5' exonuclease and polymerase domains